MDQSLARRAKACRGLEDRESKGSVHIDIEKSETLIEGYKVAVLWYAVVWTRA
jgi:hypothetical protein